MKRTPTDLELLDAIHERYYDAFASFKESAPNRNSKLYVPIDIKVIGQELGVDEDIVFGRLYYHLDQKYGYKQEGDQVHFFAMRIGGDRHCIHFPYLSSVLASLRDEDRKYRVATTVSVVSLVVSLIAIGVSLYAA